MTVNTGRLGKATNNLPKYGATLDHEGHKYLSFIILAARQEEQSF